MTVHRPRLWCWVAVEQAAREIRDAIPEPKRSTPFGAIRTEYAAKLSSEERSYLLRVCIWVMAVRREEARA